jgi:hypothetical protein
MLGADVLSAGRSLAGVNIVNATKPTVLGFFSYPKWLHEQSSTETVPAHSFNASSKVNHLDYSISATIWGRGTFTRPTNHMIMNRLGMANGTTNLDEEY